MITVSDDEPFSDENMHAQACIIMPHVKQNETTKNQNMFVFVTFCHYLLLTLDDNLKQYCKCFIKMPTAVLQRCSYELPTLPLNQPTLN